MTRSGPCLARGRGSINLLQGLSRLAVLVLSLHVASGKGFVLRELCLVCEVTAPTFVGQVGRIMTSAESLHKASAQQTLASLIMSHKEDSN